MKQYFEYLRKYAVWLLLVGIVDGMAALLLWLADVRAFGVLAGVIVLGSCLLFLAVLGGMYRKERRREQAFLAFLDMPDELREEEILRLVSPQERRMIERIREILQENQRAEREMSGQLKDYEEYVEAWAHEIKTPVSLLTFLLDNRREELPQAVCHKLDYIRSQMQESVNQMLYYARLKGGRKDYLFEMLELSECCGEVVENYRPLLEERGIQVICETEDIMVFSERRGLDFLLSQIISNSINYCKKEGASWISLTAEQTEEAISLHIRDNGIGVRSCDLPFLFEKGFTGDTGAVRKKATGMGLYLAKEIAADMKISLKVQSEWQNGFEIILSFPKIME